MPKISEKVRRLLAFLTSESAPAPGDGRWNRREFLVVTTFAATAVTTLQAASPPKKRGPVPTDRLRYQIHPSVAVARLGNSPDSFYLQPETIGGLPFECDENGNPKMSDGRPEHTRRFKDAKGRIRRQAAQFGIYAFDSADPNDPGTPVGLDDPRIESIEWTVHLANKKGAWYENDELVGNATLASASNPNYYDKNTFRNWDSGVHGRLERQRQFIIDPGPRHIARPGEKVPVSRSNMPADYYKNAGFPPISTDTPRAPYEINTLGELRMDNKGRLVLLGGVGHAGGEQPIATYTGQDTWFDDISDGPVTCRVKLKDRAEPIVLKAWALVGSPKYAPELRNISTLSDVMFDVAVRYKNLIPQLYANGSFNPLYAANYERDIAPILDRIGDYIWVANVPSMVAFTSPHFDTKDASEGNRHNRETFFSYFRDSSGNEISAPHQQLFIHNIPAMPLNSGSNSVTGSANQTGQNIDKFMGLTNTQYFLLGQWAKGKFTVGKPSTLPNSVHGLDQASVGNCVGHPMSPGIEVTWTLRNPVVYDEPYRILHAHDEEYYRQNGLSPDGDETSHWYKMQQLTPPSNIVDQLGCEPGDLTKRMSPPWMSDFYQCSIEYVNFNDPNVNVTNITQIPPPPTYYTYWWPPQAPMFVITGPMTREEQNLAGLPAGYSAYYARGANNIGNLVIAWAYMGFIVNVNDTAEAHEYPYFVEKERNHDKFVASAVAVGHPINQLAASGSYLTPTNYFTPAWYLKDEGEIAECDGTPDCKHPQ
jgi:L-lysine 6-oxidase